MSQPAAEGAPVEPAPRFKILVFAGVPPPIHGQNVMVAALLAGLKDDPNFSLIHLDPRLSSTTEDVGHGSVGKLFRILFACARAAWLRLREGPMIFYYIPAPGRRIPVFRDWIVLLFCRPLFSALILHWHAVGLGDWVEKKANFLERCLTQWALSGADLAIVLAKELQPDAERFRPKRITVIANGVEDPCRTRALEPSGTSDYFEVLFLGLGSDEKGLFRTLAGVRLANAREPGCYRLTFAGNFSSPEDEQTFAEDMRRAPKTIRRVGVVSGEAKTTLLQRSDVLCFPTHYPHEGQPLVLIEALAFDLPIITSRWRAIPGMLPVSPHIRFVDPTDESAEAIADALQAAYRAGRPTGELRAHFLAHFTLEQHCAKMADAFRGIRS